MLVGFKPSGVTFRRGHESLLVYFSHFLIFSFVHGRFNWMGVIFTYSKYSSAGDFGVSCVTFDEIKEAASPAPSVTASYVEPFPVALVTITVATNYSHKCFKIGIFNYSFS